jgi:hypothetical protein
LFVVLFTCRRLFAAKIKVRPDIVIGRDPQIGLLAQKKAPDSFVLQAENCFGRQGGRIPPLSRIFIADDSLAKRNSDAIPGLYDFAPNDLAQVRAQVQRAGRGSFLFGARLIGKEWQNHGGQNHKEDHGTVVWEVAVCALGVSSWWRISCLKAGF